MARPKSRTRQQIRVPLVIPDGMTAKKIELEPAEKPKELDQRLRKEFWTFVVDDLLTTLVALVVLVSLVAVSVVILFRSTLPEDRHFATSTLAAVGTAVVGFAFGKATKKSA